MKDGTARFTSTNDVNRALFADLDERIAELSNRLARRRAQHIRMMTFGLVKLTDEQIAELCAEYADALFSAVFNSETDRVAAILASAEACR